MERLCPGRMLMPRRAFVEWLDHLIEVRDHAELDAALDEAAADQCGGAPCTAHLCWDDAGSLGRGSSGRTPPAAAASEYGPVMR